MCGRELGRTEGVGQLNDLARELERAVIVVFDECDRRARIHADVEGFVLRKRHGYGVVHRFGRDLLSIDFESASAAFAEARTVVLELELDGMFAGLEFRAFPHDVL